MQYPELKYLPQEQDPSLTIETEELVMKVIDNTGLLVEEDKSCMSYAGQYGVNSPVGFSHLLGCHGIRLCYNKTEKRNVISPWGCWLNFQYVSLADIESDAVDERAWAGNVRGWPIKMKRNGKGVCLYMEPLPKMQTSFSMDLQPAEPDGVDFSIRFNIGIRPEKGTPSLRAAWPLYMTTFNDVRLFYPQGSPEQWGWVGLGEIPDMIVGDPVNYQHHQDIFRSEDQALPLAYGRTGDNCLMIMFSDPSVRFFVVNNGGHVSRSGTFNPAWDFEWIVEDYPLNETIGFDGRLIYTRFEGQDNVLARYQQWKDR